MSATHVQAVRDVSFALRRGVLTAFGARARDKAAHTVTGADQRAALRVGFLATRVDLCDLAD
ncbi:hypothetical protein Raf01_49080 [Rugosimonospora africana]|uniref:Uncharacterized protein n=1 Tax=Rugosimonospora africana TaxID=556532 RepID=A0A8J3VSL5_9ACTN|nr:hypothetical protein Raf01_49080 [Rugosimonospora africana]